MATTIKNMIFYFIFMGASLVIDVSSMNKSESSTHDQTKQLNCDKNGTIDTVIDQFNFYNHKQLHYCMPQLKEIMANIKKMAFYFICIGAIVINVMSYNPMLTYTVRFKRLEVQPNITVNYYTINRYKEGEFINGQITVNSKELINKAVAVFHRCDPDGINCEYFQMWTLTGLCNKLKDKNQVWSRWYGSFDPPMVCPLNKVTYQLRNATFDLGVALLLYPQVTDYQWRVVQKFYTDDIFIGSYTMEFYFFGYRKKTKSVLKLQ